jgi:hypothetical protein
MANAPFRLDQPLPIVRGANGRFQEPRAPQVGPANPLTVEATGGTPEKWAPGIGQNTAPTKSQPIPWPPSDAGKKPFRVG